ncbi:MAG: AfsR/SARP family transcriptional regulator [Mycobacteriales bacterium]
MQFGILGPLEVARDGQPLPIIAPMQRAVLAALLLDAGRVVSTDRLVERLWGALPPKTARVTLQTYVLRLRRALGPQVIRTRAPGYLVDVPPQDLDLHRFEALVQRARALRSGGSAAPAAAVLDEALRLWRGQALADVGSDHLRRTEGVQLEERRLRAVEERTDVGLELGEHADLVDRLRQLVAEHPLRERLRGQLMLALYRAGRPGEALLAYRDARRALVTELGIEPGRELQELQAAVLDRNPALDLAAPERRAVAAPRAHRIGRPTTRAAPRSTGAVATVPRHTPAAAAEPDRRDGPEQLTRFVGRVREAGEVLQLIAGIRLLTITGPAGCGKSRLVQHVLNQPGFEASHLVQVAGVADPARLPGAVAAELGLRPDGDLVDQLRGRAAVVVLDNCEHLVDACAGLAVRLLTGCPGIRLLVTSREPLAVPGEHRMRLTPLPTPRAGPRSAVGAHCDDATALFLDRAAAARPGFAVTSRLAPYVEDIVRRLDGVPLAIELAAARLDALPIEEVAARLDDQLGLLTGGSRTGRPDHRTLRRAVEWSYALLEPDERRLFQELSVFAGGFTAAAAAGVCTRPGRDTDAFGLLADLAVKSMVMVEPGARTVRYRLLEPLRQFARHRLESCGGLAERRRRHAAYFRLWAPAAGPEAVAAEEDNLREAMSWFVARDHVGAATELAAILDRSRPDTGTRPPAERPATHRELAVLGSFAAGRGRYAAATSLYRRALRSAQAGGGLHAAAEYLILLAELEAVTGRAEAAYPLLDQAARLYLALDDATGLATATLQRGELAAVHGDHAVARALLADASERLRQLGVPAGTARAQLALGRLALADGSPAVATAALVAALVTFHQLGDRGRLASTLELLAMAARDPVRAATLLAAAELLRQAAEAVPAPVDQVRLAGTVDRVRRELDPADFELARERGRSRTVAETVRFACLPEAAAPLGAC